MMLEGHVSVGGVTSRTFTLKRDVELFPAESCAVQVMSVEPTANELPDPGVQVTAIGDVQLSVAVGVGKLTVAEHAVAEAFTETFAGGAICGGAPSVTVTVNEHVDVFPAASTAVAVTVVFPGWNTEPLAGT